MGIQPLNLVQVTRRHMGRYVTQGPAPRTPTRAMLPNMSRSVRRSASLAETQPARSP
ncbi:hypothetical protein B0T26DRAFT_731082 [Lasiosphaeria miniovina]|uniref:Uncharacterized protein n=1 Tax=Lasiosphaeria miniovina TaxID=1954250 RepID=A0AA39ZTF2_9PEZI|nr:uncharacterized protein B0T26DRAFT_731082 [Lasiosphaeria miniovina]KAK0703364.1 hypothetical protein B0T26DRAFT_731082 [Lasiosphaeria miniovina]